MNSHAVTSRYFAAALGFASPLAFAAALGFAAALTLTGGVAHAQTPAPIPWMLTPDMGYGYGADGKTLTYKMGTNNAKFLLKGAKKVPRNTLFFVGENGQLYMRSGPYLEGDGRFMFGPS